jgi:uncharacterized protein
MKTEKQPQTCTLYVDGMHCAACELLIERKLKKAKGVKSVDAKLSSGIVEITGTFNESAEELAAELTNLVEKDGYSIHTTRFNGKKAVDWSEYIYALPVALVIILVFIGLQKIGLVNLINADSLNLPAAFIIGIVASLSSCAAVVGGLLLSLSSTFSMEDKRTGVLSGLSFHVGRLISFFILGGAIGWIGSLFTITGESRTSWTFFTSMFTAVIMLLLAIGLLTSSNFFHKLTPKLPKRLSNKLLGVQDISTSSDHKMYTFIAMGISALAGIVTFFLPCGFTQSIQLYALGTGSFMNGALTLLAFALGTLPVLALINFASVNLAQDNKYSGIFFKVSGILVLFFAVINILGALAVIGVIDPVLNF